MPIIDVQDLVKVYPRGEVRAVDGVTLAVEEGEVFGFLGPNGAGKTTTVRVMTTLLTPTSGIVRIAGHDVVTAPAAVRASIGVALQEVGLSGLSTAREFLEMQAKLFAVPNPRDRAGELLEIVGLSDVGSRRIRAFSGGMKRRLDLAAALVHRPRVLFLDEPTTGLDPASRANVWQEVRRLNEMGTTIFLTTQYLEEADVLCERLAIIDEGRIVAEGSPAEMKAGIGVDVILLRVESGSVEGACALLSRLGLKCDVDAANDTIELATPNGAQTVPQLVREFDAAGLVVREITMRHPSLDDVFLHATGHRLEGAESESATLQEVPA